MLTVRGHERFVEKPLSVSTGLGRQSTSTVFDQQRIAMAQLREEEAARIKNEQELMADLYDFSYLREVDDYGFPLSTPYAVPDSVPDMYVPAPGAGADEKNIGKQAPGAGADENSVSNGGSVSEPSGGAE